MAGARRGNRRAGALYISLGRELILQAIAGTSERTYEGYFGGWVQFRMSLGLPTFLSEAAGVASHTRCLLAYVAYAWGTNGLQASTSAGNLAAVKFFHRRVHMFDLTLRHAWVVDALKGVARSHADTGTVVRVCRPVAWSVLPFGESLCDRWGAGVRVLWLVLDASFFFLTRAGEMFAGNKGRWDATHCLGRGEGALFRGGTQLDWTFWNQADSVQV